MAKASSATEIHGLNNNFKSFESKLLTQIKIVIGGSQVFIIVRLIVEDWIEADWVIVLAEDKRQQAAENEISLSH